MKKTNYSIFLFFLFAMSTSLLYSQNMSVKGNVRDSKGEILPGVSIQVKGTKQGATTDFDGNYTISANKGDILVFSYVGFKTKETTVTEPVINITLEEDTNQLDEVVITAFGIKKKEKELTYAVTQVNASDLEQGGHNDPLSALQGKVAGLQINRNSGSAGGGTDILIRGISSVNPSRNNQPLIIVDGVAINNDNFSGNILPTDGTNSPGSAEQFAFSSRSGDINPEDVESYSVLKGAAATALYGIRAANGAIIITTKKGKEGKAKISFTTSTSMRDVKKTPELQKTYREGWRGRPEILYTPDTPTGFTSVYPSVPFHTWGPKYSDDYYEFAPDNIVDLRNDKFYNPFDLFQTGFNSQVNFNIAGASDKIDYFFSVGNNYDTSIVPNSYYGKTNVRFNGGYQVTDKFKINSSISYINSGGRRANGGDKSIISSLAYYTTTFPINDYKNPDGSQRNYTPWLDNPRYFAEVSSLTDNVNRWIGNTTLSWQAKDWVSFNYTIQIDNYSDSRNRFVPPELDTGTKVHGFVINELINFTGIESNFLATFTKNLSEKVNTTFTLGQQVSDTKRDYNRLAGEGLNIPHVNHISNTTNRYNSNSVKQIRNIGVFGELKIDYDNKLFLNLTGRNDWVSTLPKENRSFFYPSASMSYIFTQDFLKDNSIFSFGKLRLSWAQVGKGPEFGHNGHYFRPATGFPFGGVGGYDSDTALGDPNMIPEKTNSLEVGLDLRFLKNRIKLDYTYYKSKVHDQIFNVNLPYSTGYSLLTRNAGNYETSGHEFMLSADIIKKENLNWETTFNFTTSEGIVTDLPDDVESITFGGDGGPEFYLRVKEGDKMGSLYGYNWRYEDGQRYIAPNGYPVLDQDNGYVVVGNAFPDYVMTMGNTVKWKKIGLNFLLEYKKGGDKYSWARRQMIRNGTSKITELRNIEDYVMEGVMEDPANPGQYIPNTTTITLNQNLYRSLTKYTGAAEVYLQDASWVKLRSIGLNYDFSSLFDKISFIDGVVLNIDANNILIWTPYDGYDPEGSAYSAGSNVYGLSGKGIPLSQSYMVGLKINF
jgi:TonB-linked SusC/RagA family outer membrane protein